MEHRRSWTATLDGVDHRIDVVYAALSGWMTIEVDGQRCQRGWREWQTVFGGAELSCDVHGHRVDARITQPFGQQAYSFALRIDDQLQPGSDPQPEPGNLKRQTLIAIGLLALVIFVATFVPAVLRALG
jgi:hypothetical protein